VERLQQDDLKHALDAIASLDRQISQCKIDIMSNLISDNVEKIYLQQMLENYEIKLLTLLKQVIEFKDLSIWIRLIIYKQHSTGYCYSSMDVLKVYKNLTRVLQNIVQTKIIEMRNSGEISSRLYITLGDVEKMVARELCLTANILEHRKYELAIEEALQANFQSLLIPI
jgi:hypothetical protein